MKILVLSNLYPPDFIGGYEIACAQMVDAFNRRGHEVRVLASAPRTPVPEAPGVLRRFQLAEEWNWSAHDLWSHPLGARLRDVKSRLVNAFNVHVLLTALEEFEPDVLYLCNLVGLGGLALIACLNDLKVPWVWQLGDNVPGILCGMADGTIPALAEEFSRQIEGHYVVVSQQLVRQIEASGVTLRGEVDVIPNWIVGDRPPGRSSYYRGGTLRIMSAGQVSHHKGIEIIIEAAAGLRAAGFHDFVLDIYGKIYSPDFADAIRRHGLGEHVTLMGVRSQSELMALYGRYDVFTFPTMEREPFGLVPLEAASRGCVPIITQRCGIAEWLVHGVHCLKSARTAEAFTGFFRAILEGRIDLEPIGRRAEEAAWRDFHIDAIFPAIEHKLRAAARQSRAGAGTAGNAYHMARLAEHLAQVFVEESSQPQSSAVNRDDQHCETPKVGEDSIEEHPRFVAKMMKRWVTSARTLGDRKARLFADRMAGKRRA